MSFKLKLENSRILKGIIETLSSIIDETEFLVTPEEVQNLVVGVNDGKPIFLRDVATVRHGPDQSEQYAWFGTGPAADTKNINEKGEFPAVTIAIAKQGTNGA